MKSNRGLIVLISATGINLALGILYSWSIFKESIRVSIVNGGDSAFNWNLAQINDPYALACLVFAFVMIPAGRFQDKVGPRITAFCGGVLVSLGFLTISFSVSYWFWLFGFGGLVGSGLAFGYAAATPAALKWFSPKQSGLIAGIVVAGFGLAPSYIAPLATFLVGEYGILPTMEILSISFFIVVSLLASQLATPPEQTIPVAQNNLDTSRKADAKEIAPYVQQSFKSLIHSSKFWSLWLLYFVGAGTGLIVIGSVSGLAKQAMGENAYLAVAILALGNASGRVIAGWFADRYGRLLALRSVFVFQALLIFLVGLVSDSSGALVIVFGATLIGFNYGANLALFPSYAKALWGLPQFGFNYGMLFTAWGVGGFVMVKVSEVLRSQSGSFQLPFYLAGVLLLLVLPLTQSLRTHS